MEFPKKGFTIWFTGLPCSGKTTLSDAVAEKLKLFSLPVEQLDGDELRKRLSPDLGFSKTDRGTHLGRVVSQASRLTNEGVTALVSLVSPYRAHRQNARRLIRPFIEVYVRCPLAVCEHRDVKGMYRLARQGKIQNFTGVSGVYEKPLDPEVIVDTDLMDVELCAQKVMHHLRVRFRLTNLKEMVSY